MVLTLVMDMDNIHMVISHTKDMDIHPCPIYNLHINSPYNLMNLRIINYKLELKNFK